MTLLSKCWFR